MCTPLKLQLGTISPRDLCGALVAKMLMQRGFRLQRLLAAPLRRHLAAAADAPLRRTPLYDSHIALGGKMVPFGGWEMPVQYDKTEKGSILKSHMQTR